MTGLAIFFLGIFLLTLVIELEGPDGNWFIDWPEHFMPQTERQQDITFALGIACLVLGIFWPVMPQ